jgi:hypothetical protein
VSARLVRLLAGVSLAGPLHAAVNMALLRRPRAMPPVVRQGLTVVLPVRDEEHQVAACLAAALHQRGVPDLRVVVVDDGSTDGTADAVRSVADPRVRLIQAGEPPPGWLGKPHACAVGATIAEGMAVEPDDDGVLVFLDADVRLRPDAVAGAVALFDEYGLDLVSLWPRPLTESAAERLVQPLFPWLWATMLTLRPAERSPRPWLAAANGQFLVVREAGYWRAGGHGAVRGDVMEDLALLRAIKRSGGRGVSVDGSRLAACRMYEGWPTLRDGYTEVPVGHGRRVPGGEPRRGRCAHCGRRPPRRRRAARVARRAPRVRRRRGRARGRRRPHRRAGLARRAGSSALTARVRRTHAPVGPRAPPQDSHLARPGSVGRTVRGRVTTAAPARNRVWMSLRAASGTPA